jgi:hypothetical protein
MALPPTLPVMTKPITHAAKAQWNKRVGKSQMRTVSMGTFMGAGKKNYEKLK